MPRIEPVDRADYEQALALLVGGQADAPSCRSVWAFGELLRGPEADRCRLWWVRTIRGARAVALTVRNPGRAAMIFSTPAARRTAALIARLLDCLSASVLSDNVRLVQALLPPGSRCDREAYGRAGFLRLAQLVYAARDLGEPIAPDSSGLGWPPFAPGDEAELARVIADTYVGSRDCPDMLGRRDTADVIASHKSSGVFTPRSWWLPRLGGEPVGCVLCNLAPGGAGSAEIVYLGVRPAFRRKGMATAMIRHALSDAVAAGLCRVHLAVDAGNTPALTLYQREGFVEMDRRDVLVRYADPAERRS